MDTVEIVAKQERIEQAKKLRSDAINRILYTDKHTIESMRAELWLSRTINIAALTALLCLGARNEFLFLSGG